MRLFITSLVLGAFMPFAALAADDKITDVSVTLSNTNPGETTSMRVEFTTKDFAGGTNMTLLVNALPYESSGFSFESADVNDEQTTIVVQTLDTTESTNHAVALLFHQPITTDDTYFIDIFDVVNPTEAGEYTFGLSSSLYNEPGNSVDVTLDDETVTIGSGEGGEEGGDEGGDEGEGEGGEEGSKDDGGDEEVNDSEKGTGDGTGDTVESLGTVASIARLSNKRVRVNYSKGGSKVFQMFGKGTAKPKVQLHTNNNLLVAVSKRRIRTFDAFTGDRIQQKKHFKNTQAKVKFKRYNLYKKSPQNNVVVMTRTKTSKKQQVKLRSYVITKKGKIRKRSKVVVALEKNAKWSKLRLAKNKKFGKKNRVFLKKNGKRLRAETYWVTKKRGAIRVRS